MIKQQIEDNLKSRDSSSTTAFTVSSKDNSDAVNEDNSKLGWDFAAYARKSDVKSIRNLLLDNQKFVSGYFLFHQEPKAIQAIRYSIKNDKVEIIAALLSGGGNPFQKLPALTKVPPDKFAEIRPSSNHTNRYITDLEKEECNDHCVKYQLENSHSCFPISNLFYENAKSTWQFIKIFSNGYAPNIEYINQKKLETWRKHNMQLDVQQMTLLEETATAESENIFMMISSHVNSPNTALISTCIRGTAAMLKQLLKRGANPNYRQYGMSSLISACTSLIDSIAKIELLLQYGADANFHLKNEYSPLMQTTMNEDLAAMELLLKNGANPNEVVELAGLPTPLFYAVYWGKVEMIELLLKYKPDIHIRKQNKTDILELARTSLHFATLRKPKHIARLPLPKTSAGECRNICSILGKYQRENIFASRFISPTMNHVKWESPCREEAYKPTDSDFQGNS
ncbi:ankyrin repeat-containing protein [Cardiosporidium cionae]|uniref:Ankyrin repeat-containing protein n=1 Tax=Cardiosporidium cionae TaxID=476202 RepID=A0ABQ7JDK8_9APIC|nr:ankyrin repeat-containing protein [Cardiosporidium cionae]|eukprot:KAF8822056.1 ankyrin repeat-containing protein [Cardiosporidium cionae]